MSEETAVMGRVLVRAPGRVVKAFLVADRQIDSYPTRYEELDFSRRLKK